MSEIFQIVKKNLSTLEPKTHGGNVWSVTNDDTIRYRKLLDFSSNINPLGPSRKVLDAIKNNLWKIDYYPPPDAGRLREIIARQYHGLTFKNVIVGNGSTELIYLFADVFTQKNTSAIITIPTFSEYESAVIRAGGKVKNLNSESQFQIDTESISKIIRKNDIIIICNPNNPTGTLTKRNDLQKIVKIAAEKQVLVFIDEAFMDFVEDHHRYSLASEVNNHKNLFVLRSLTKFHSLAGLRLGYGLASVHIIDLLHTAMIPWNVNCLAQAAAEVALGDQKYEKKTRKYIVAERSFIINHLKKNPLLHITESTANFLLIDARATGLTGLHIASEAFKKGLLIRDCSSFKGLDKYYIRIAIKTRKQNLVLLKFLDNIFAYGKVKDI